MFIIVTLDLNKKAIQSLVMADSDISAVFKDQAVKVVFERLDINANPYPGNDLADYLLITGTKDDTITSVELRLGKVKEIVHRAHSEKNIVDVQLANDINVDVNRPAREHEQGLRLTYSTAPKPPASPARTETTQAPERSGFLRRTAQLLGLHR